MNPNDQEFLTALNRSFVSLSWVDCETDLNGQATKNPRVFCTSGFVIEYQGEWYWVTAGHLLDDLDHELPRINRRIVTSQLLAGWNSEDETVEHIPFDYSSCMRYYENDDEEGTDLGVVYLPESLKCRLRHAGVTPIRKLDCPDQEYDQYMVHGLPKKEQRDDIEHTDEYIAAATSIMPVAFRVFPITDGNGGFPTTKQKLFYASVPAEVSLETLDGVSGGPIYGLKQAEGRLDCFVAAVQNGERKLSKTIAACPSRLFNEILARAVADINRQLGQSS